MKHGLFSALCLLGCALPAHAAEHVLSLSPKTVQFGRFDAAIPPVLTINSGDIVTIETAARVEPSDVDASGAVSRTAVPGAVRAVFDAIKDRGPGAHVLTGPIAITGAEPGDVLEVRILKVDLAVDYGYNIQLPDSGVLRDAFSARWLRIIPIDRARRTARVAPGVTVPVARPFLGLMGVASAPSAGRVSSMVPGDFAGNLDNKELGEGATLFIPVHARGALFSAGDGHAAQGDGEVDLSAIETGLNARLQFILHKGMTLATPRAETPTHWIAIGLAPTLDEALRKATRETIDIIRARHPDLTPQEAYMIASVAVDYHVTQAVDDTLGVHGLIPKAIFADREKGRP